MIFEKARTYILECKTCKKTKYPYLSIPPTPNNWECALCILQRVNPTRYRVIPTLRKKRNLVAPRPSQGVSRNTTDEPMSVSSSSVQDTGLSNRKTRVQISLPTPKKKRNDKIAPPPIPNNKSRSKKKAKKVS